MLHEYLYEKYKNETYLQFEDNVYKITIYANFTHFTNLTHFKSN